MATTINYRLGSNPIWYIANNLGLPAAGAFLEAVDNLNLQVLKPVYRDAGGPDGAGPWPVVPVPNKTNTYGIQFNANGQQGPFYFQFDTANSDSLYSLFVYDSSGNLIWTALDYDPSGGGGGSVITEVQNAQNFIVNPLFWRNIGSITPIASTAFRIAPGAHSALAQTSSNANPDIWFIKGNTSATDSLTFPNFTFGLQEFYPPDQTPPFYLRYTCTAAGTSEGSKSIQIPIMQNVTNFANTVVTTKFWANNFGDADRTITLYWWQFFGDGATATAPIQTPINTFTIPSGSGWNSYTVSATVPSVVLSPTPAVIGACGNDGIFLRVGLPLNATCDLGITKPSMYLNAVTVQTDYVTYDQIDSVINAPRTGHLVYGLDSSMPGYALMNDTTIGSTGSNAATKGTFTFPLYNLIWNATNTNTTTKTWAPVATSLGVITTRGASATADFEANKQLLLFYSLGAVIGNVGLPNSAFYLNLYGSPWLIGEPFGDEQDTAPLPSHTHATLANTAFVETTLPGSGTVYTSGNSGTFHTTTASAGVSATPLHNTIQPTLRFNLFIKF